MIVSGRAADVARLFRAVFSAFSRALLSICPRVPLREGHVVEKMVPNSKLMQVGSRWVFALLYV